MKLIVGLGNPGVEYEKTRHNAGFLAIDTLARRHAPAATPRSRFHAWTVETTPASGPAAGQRLLLMKPTTYMNRSGQAVADALRFFKLNPASDLFIIVDDIYLPSGAIRVRGEGGSGGHNGLEDIERLLATKAYPRCRVGVDSPPGGAARQADYVLGRFSPDQWDKVAPALDRAADAAELWAGKGLAEAMNRCNTKELTE